MHEMSVMLHEQGRDDATSLNFKKFGDQKYLFYVIICILKCMVIKTIFCGDQNTFFPSFPILIFSRRARA